MAPRRLALLASASAFVAIPAVTCAVTRHVPVEYGTINAGLDASSPGDSVLVAPGVYDQCETRIMGNGCPNTAVAFLKGGVCLVSEAGASATTLRLDASVTGPEVCTAFGEAGTVTVSGFTLSGTATGVNAIYFGFSDRLIVRDCVVADIAIGIGCVSGDVEVHDCRFENIRLSGGAINQTSGTLIVEDSEFLNCRQGAVALRFDAAFPHAASVTVRRCRFVGNEVTLGGGAGLYVQDYASALVEDSWFEANRADGSSPSGGAILFGGYALDVVIRGCTFANNFVTGAGTGGGARIDCHDVTLENNTFYGNSQQIDWSHGGAAVTFGGWTQVFRNNVIAHSAGDQAVGFWGTGSIETACNVYWDNPLGSTSGFQPDSTDLQANPMFCDVAASDFHVNAASPCIPGNGNPSCTELIGAWPAGCGATSAGGSVESRTWGSLKSLYR
ncbi:MAG: right-handed parallel beta-helix repeat-containing protein [bacterium]